MLWRMRRCATLVSKERASSYKNGALLWDSRGSFLSLHSASLSRPTEVIFARNLPWGARASSSSSTVSATGGREKKAYPKWWPNRMKQVICA